MRAGNTAWLPGPCLPVLTDDVIILTGTPIDPFPSIGLNWDALTTEYAFFSVRKRLIGTEDWTVLDVVDGNVFSFTDDNPNGSSSIEFQIIGTAIGGYAVYSNILIIDLPEPPGGVVNVYPVPAIQDIIIKVPVEGIYELEILDTSGRLLRKFKKTIPAASPVSVNINNLKNGVYLLRLRHNDGTLYIKRFIKINSGKNAFSY